LEAKHNLKSALRGFATHVYKRRGVGGQKKPNLVKLNCFTFLIAAVITYYEGSIK
jgi:hypothetical protein